MYDAPFIMDACSRAVLQLFRGSGGKALYESNPLQWHFRDIHAMTQHVAMDLDRAGETYGRLLFHRSRLGAWCARQHAQTLTEQECVTSFPRLPDQPIWDIWLSMHRLPAMAVADQLGVFGVLDAAPATTAATVQRLGLNRRATDVLLAC